jgi:hypothetical protein
MSPETTASRPRRAGTLVLRSVQALLLYVFVAGILGAMDGRLEGDDHYSLWTTVSARAGTPFFDPGSPLQSWLSFAGQWLSGFRTIGEVGVTVLLRLLGMIAAYVLTRRLAGVVAAFAACAGIALLTLGATVYSADKFFIYPVAILAIWSYLDGRLPVWALGAAAAISFLFRHDHGVYVSLPMALAVLVRAPGQLPAFVGSALVALSPWLLVVHNTEGIVEYFAERIAFARQLGLGDARPELFYFEMPLVSRANAARYLWHLVWIADLLACWAAWRTRDLRAGVLALTVAVAITGLMRRTMQVNDLATIWIPMLAWLTARYRVALAVPSALAVVAAGMLAGVTTEGYQIFIDNGGIVGRPISALSFHLADDPLEGFAPADAEDERLLYRYVAQCLADGDRLWDTTIQFPLSYYTRHPLVDHPYWSMGYRHSDAAQQATLASLAASPAPLIVMARRADPNAVFAPYPRIREYVAAHYRALSSPTFEAWAERYQANVTLLADTRRPANSRFEPFDLPCYGVP